jgi:serine/threonine protein kinase
MKDVMTAVGDLHARGILHRDIKPDNIHYDLISRKATVIDLGMALFTHDPVRGVIGESVGGTPGFMSPDAEVGTYSEKSELYALGITFAELLDLVVYKSHRIEVFNTEFTVPLVQTVDDPDRENVIKDDNTRLALLTMLQEMTNKNSSLSMRSLPGKTNVVEFLDKVRDEYLDTLGLTNRVAYVNIADLIGDVNEVADMLLAIRQQDIDQIWLIDDNGLYQSEYLDTRHLLTQYGFNISDAVVQYRGDNLEQTMNNYADQREHSDRNIYDARFVTKTGQVVSLKSTIEAEQINKIISSLEEEVQLAIQEDPTQPRIAMIKDAIAAFEKVNQANPVSLVAVLKDLDQLQSNMLHSQESQQNIRFLMTSLQLSAPATPVPAKKTINQQELLKDLDRLKKINPPPAKAVPPPLPPGIVKTPAVPPPLPVGYKKSPAVPPPVPAQYGKVPPPLPPRPAKNAGQPPPLAKPGQAPALDKPPNQGFQRLGLFGGAKDKAPAAVIPH